MRKMFSSKLFSKILVVCIIAGLIFSSIICTNASLYNVQKIFGERDRVFKNACLNSGFIGNKSEYPIKNPTGKKNTQPKFSQLGFDILLGTSRPLVTYTGEIPKKWKDAEGLTLVPYTELSPASDYTHYFGISKDELKSVDEGGELKAVQEYAGDVPNKDNKYDVKSIRMYALTKSNSGLIDDFSTVAYLCAQGVCNLSASVTKILISAKNISIGLVLEKLKINKVIKLFNKVFIKNQGKLSIFMIFAIASFILAIVGYAFAFARGKQKKTSLSNLLIIAFLGLTLVSMSTTQNTSGIATKSANAISSICATLVYDSVVSGDKIWKSKATGKNKNDSTVVSYNEQTLVNKTLIELQILNQFGVSNISELQYKKLGGSTTTIPFSKLSKNEKNLATFDGNLGYYFWYANSPAPIIKGSLTNTFRTGKYNSAKVVPRLEGVMSYLQYAYDNGTAAQKAKILNIVDHFANPRVFNGVALYALLTLEYILLLIVLFGLTIRILIAKLLAAGSVLGLPIAGVLMITTRKTMVKWGKMIVLMLVTYSIQIFILSVIFDLILNILGILIAPNFLSIMLALAATVMLLLFMPTLYRKLNRLFDSINDAIGARDITTMQKRVKSWGSNKFNNFTSKTKPKTKIVKDADGNEHEVQVQGTSKIQKAASITAILSGAGARGGNLTNLGAAGKIGGDVRKEARAADMALSSKLRADTKEATDEANADRNSRYADMFVGKEKSYSNLDYTKLNSTEQQAYSDIAFKASALQSKQATPEFRRLQDKISAGKELTQQERLLQEEYSRDARNISVAQNNLMKAVENRVSQEALADHKKDILDKVSVEERTNKELTNGVVRDKTDYGEISEHSAAAKTTQAAVQDGDLDKAVAGKTTRKDAVAQKVEDGTATVGEKIQHEMDKTQGYKSTTKPKYKESIVTASEQNAMRQQEQPRTRPDHSTTQQTTESTHQAERTTQQAATSRRTPEPTTDRRRKPTTSNDVSGQSSAHQGVSGAYSGKSSLDNPLEEQQKRTSGKSYTDSEDKFASRREKAKSKKRLFR